MPEQPSGPLPGDVVQVTDKADKWFTTLLVVEENRRWGLMAYMPTVTPDGVAPAYYRLAHGAYRVVGIAALVPGEIAEARQLAIQTARDLAREQGESNETEIDAASSPPTGD